MATPLLIRNAEVWTVADGVLPCADVLILNGRIARVGCDIAPPCEVETIDAEGKILTPGLIDVHTHMGLWEDGRPEDEGSGNEATSPLTPQLRAFDAINPRDRSFAEARRAGVTTVQVLPGSANVVGGQCAILKTAGTNVDRMLRKAPSGMKAAFGQNPKNVYRERKAYPSTRMAVAAALRECFVDAGNYVAKLEERDEKGEPKSRERNLAKEAMAAVLRKEMPLRVHAHRADDILTALRIAEEFGVACTIEHGTEGHLVADILAEKGIHVAFGPTLTSRMKLEVENLAFGNAVTLVDAGVHLALTTDHPVIPIIHIMVQAAELVRTGLSEERVFRMLTLDAAAHLGMEKEFGSVDAGKVADLALWSGNPFSYRSVVLRTIVEGETVFREGAA